MNQPITLGVIKADVGGYVGHSAMHPALLEEAKRLMEESQEVGQIVDFHVTSCGDDLQLIMTHHMGIDQPDIQHIAWDVFTECTKAPQGSSGLPGLIFQPGIDYLPTRYH